MMKMLEYLAIPHIGRHHSGIDDVRNLSNIVIHLLQKGAEFKKHDSSDNTPAIFKPGDWICSNCNEVNFARRTSCYGCGKARR